MNLVQVTAVVLCYTNMRTHISWYIVNINIYIYTTDVVHIFMFSFFFYQVGILSFGSSCDSSTIFPSAFVNVQRYTRWILENS